MSFENPFDNPVEENKDGLDEVRRIEKENNDAFKKANEGKETFFTKDAEANKDSIEKYKTDQAAIKEQSQFKGTPGTFDTVRQIEKEDNEAFRKEANKGK